MSARERVQAANRAAEAAARAAAAEQRERQALLEEEERKRVERTRAERQRKEELDLRIATASYNGGFPLPLLRLILAEMTIAELLIMQQVSLYLHKLCTVYFETAYVKTFPGIYIMAIGLDSWKKRCIGGKMAVESVEEGVALARQHQLHLMVLTPGRYFVQPRWSMTISIPLHIVGAGFVPNYAALLARTSGARSSDVLEGELASITPNIVIVARNHRTGLFWWRAKSGLVRDVSLVLEAESADTAHMYTAFYVNKGAKVELINCRVESFQHSAVSVELGGDCICEHSVLTSHAAHGAQVFGTLQARNSVFIGCDNSGLEVWGHCSLSKCVVTGNAHSGVAVVADYEGQGEVSESRVLRLDGTKIFDNALYGVEIVAECKLTIHPTCEIWRNVIGYIGPIGIIGDSNRAIIHENYTEDIRVRELTENLQEVSDAALAAGRCPVMDAGPQHVRMKKWYCHTCRFEGFRLLCAPCAKHHEEDGHKISEGDMGTGFCDCYLDKTTHCPLRPSKNTQDDQK